MKIRPLILLGVVAILVHYLVLSSLENAFILPELAIVLLVLAFSQLKPIEIISAALVFGYLADNLGAVERGSLLLSYFAVGVGLAALRSIEFEVTLTQKVLLSAASLIVFHGLAAAFASPVLIRTWFGLVLVQLASASLIVIANTWAQRRWDPSQ